MMIDNKDLRALDIFISEHLYNRPVFMWWYVSNHDGDDVTSYFTDKDISENGKEPLYQIKKDEDEYWDVHYQILERDNYNGVHRWNLRKIPEYSLDLNLIHKCEEKLIELGYDTGVYLDHIEMILNKLLNKYGRFDIAHASAEVRAVAMVEMIKNKLESNK